MLNIVLIIFKMCYIASMAVKTQKKVTKSKPKKNTRYFDFYDDIKIDGRDTEW